MKRSYRRFKEERCPRSSRNIRRQTERGEEVEEGGTVGIGCSVFLGRSNFSTTHFSLADCSPNPHKKHMITFNRKSPDYDERLCFHKTDSTINFPQQLEAHYSEHEHSLDFHLKEKNELNPKDSLISETCLDNDEH